MRTIFISLDTVGASRLSCLGGSLVKTPNLDRLAAESALFSSAFASDIPTQPSHTSVFTGRFGISTGIVSHFHPPANLAEDVAWLPSEFRDRGHRTGAVDHLFAMKEWFVRGYEDYMVPSGRSRSPASVVNDMAFPWLDKNRDSDFFLFLHYWDAHIPYVPPEPFKSEMCRHLQDDIDPFVQERLFSKPTYPLFKRNLYDHLDTIPSLAYIEALHYAEVAYLDHELGRLFDKLADLGVLDDAMVVVFGDHGEIMTEHDAWFDHAGLYDSVVHVPLMIRAPGLVEPSVHDAIVQLVDVMPTVLDLQGVPHPAPFDGRSLVPLMRGETTRHREYAVLSESTWQAKRGIRTNAWKYIRCWDPGVYPRSGPELYDLRDDPGEQVNLCGRYPDVAAQLDAELTAWMVQSLDGRPDPMAEVLELGLPAVKRLEGVIRDDRGGEAVPVIDLRETLARGSAKTMQLAR